MLEVGRIRRPHGLGGEVVVEFFSNRPERTQVGAAFDTDRATLHIEHVRPFGSLWLVRFEGVAGRQEAEALRGTSLRAPAIRDDQALWVHELVGANAVRSSDGRLVGRVAAVVSNPASDLLELEDGTLVPVRFVVARTAGQVELDLPVGLIDG
jgi:16S rRNA processing protein RimM